MQSKNLNLQKRTRSSKFSVAFLLLNDFTLFTFSGFVDALRIAGDDADNSQQKDCLWTIISPDLKPIKANCGVEVMPWELFPDPNDFDYLVVVGGRIEPQKNLAPEINNYIRKVAQNGNIIIGLCTASFVLARAGVMKNRTCCVHWFHRSEFIREFPNISVRSDSVYLRDKDRITCPGGSSAVDIALFLINKHCNVATTRKVVSGLVIEQMRNEDSPQPQAESLWYSEIKKPLVRRAISIMDQSLTKIKSIEEIAEQLNISENTIYRIFRNEFNVSPAKIFRALRLSQANWMIRKTALSISEISHYFCFSDSSHFSRLHKKYYGCSPISARKNLLCNPNKQADLEPIIENILLAGFSTST